MNVEKRPKSDQLKNQEKLELGKLLKLKIRPEGVEPPTCGSVVRCSIQLSHGRLYKFMLDIIGVVKSQEIDELFCFINEIIYFNLYDRKNCLKLIKINFSLDIKTILYYIKANFIKYTKILE